MADTRHDPAGVLLAYDGSEGARHAIARAGALLGPRPARVLVVWRSTRQAAEGARLALPDHVIEQGLVSLDEAAAHEAARLAGEGADLAAEAGFEATALAVEAADGEWRTIVDTAQAERCAAVVMGSRGRSGVKQLLLGSVSHGVLSHAGLPVLIVPGETAAADGPPLVAYDGSANATHAIEEAARLVSGRAVTVANCWEPLDQVMLLGGAADASMTPQLWEMNRALDEQSTADAERLAGEGADHARAAGLDAEPIAVCAAGGVWAALEREAERRSAAALVVGTRGLSGMASALGGSVARALVHHARRPVLVVPPVQ